MPVSGLVVTLTDDPNQRSKAVSALENDDRITTGELQKNRLPIVVDTETISEGAELMRAELMDLEGVIFVDLITVNFEDDID